MNPYAVLGLAQNASAEECKNAFRKLAKTCHPDLHPNDPAAEARFKEINAAYEAITNPQPEPAQHQQHWNFHFDPFNGLGANSPFGDIFHQFRQQQQSYQIALSLEEAFHGKEVTLQVSGNGTSREMKVRIPPGVEDGMRLMVQGAGQQIHPNLPPGDLTIVVRIAPHARFTRQGINLFMTVPVTAFDVLLGNEIEVVSLDGHTMRVAIPADFDTSRKLRLAGQGMPNGTGIRGDLLVDLYVQFPTIPKEHVATIRQIANSISKTNI